MAQKAGSTGGGGQTQAGPGKAVIVSTAKNSGKHRLIGIVLAVLIAAGLTGLLWAAALHYTSQKKPAPGKPVPETPAQQADRLDHSGDYAQQAQVLEKQLADNPPKQEEVQATFKLAAAYLNAQEYQKAIDTYKKLPDFDPRYSVDSYHGQAFAYERLGNKPAAIDMYKKAIAVMKNGQSGQDSQHASLIAIDEASIKALGGTP